MDTFEEMCDRIVSKVDMIELLELLDITVPDILERFEDRVMINQDKLEGFLNDSPR